MSDDLRTTPTPAPAPPPPPPSRPEVVDELVEDLVNLENGMPQGWSLRALSAPGAVGVVTLRTACLVILTLLALMAAMYLLREVLVPFVLAVFLSLLISPLINAMVHRLHWPRSLAIVVCFAAGTFLLTGVLAAAVPTALNLVEEARSYADSVGGAVDRTLGYLPFDVPATVRDPIVEQAPGRIFSFAYNVGGNVMSLINRAILVGIFLLFLLLGRGDNPVPPDSLRGQIERRIQGYLAIMLVISAMTGVAVGTTLELLGVPFGWIFGALAFVLNFIPNIGSMIATVLPLPVVLFNPELSLAAKVMAFMIPTVIQFSIGNLLTPKLLGDTLELSPVAVLLGLILFGTIWGPPGMILSTPMLAVVQIAFARIPMLVPVADALAGRLGTGGAESASVAPPTTAGQ